MCFLHACFSKYSFLFLSVDILSEVINVLLTKSSIGSNSGLRNVNVLSVRFLVVLETFSFPLYESDFLWDDILIMTMSFLHSSQYQFLYFFSDCR